MHQLTRFLKRWAAAGVGIGIVCAGVLGCAAGAPEEAAHETATSEQTGKTASPLRAEIDLQAVAGSCTQYEIQVLGCVTWCYDPLCARATCSCL